MLKSKGHFRGIGIAAGVALLTLAGVVSTDGWAGDRGHEGRPDSLYVADTSPAEDFFADTVKRFGAITGKYQGVFVQPAAGGLHGPRGLIFNYRGDLLVSNQNVNLDPPLPGDVLRFDGRSGAFKNELVAISDPNAPVSPQGIASSEDGRHLFVTDLGETHQNYCHQAHSRCLPHTEGSSPNLIPPPGKLAADSYHPRAVVIGPDRRVYVSNMPNYPVPGAAGTGGQVLRFDQKTLLSG